MAETLSTGTILGHWRIVRLLGSGGMAHVYEVEDVRLGSHNALKLFRHPAHTTSGVKERFFAEGKLLAKLDHPRLVRVIDLGEDEHTHEPYFVMDLVLNPEGRVQTLADADLTGSDEQQIAQWYDDLRAGLNYIHAHGVLHRDLKLQNVLIGSDGHAVLSDFGVAKIFDSDLREQVGLTAEMTLHALKDGRTTVMGSVGYMAPEVEMGVAASVQSDWYALGVLVFHLLTGVWCDARTDVVGDLETYHPVWREIIPKLLMSNPAGRVCLSWHERAEALREKQAFEQEQLYETARAKLARAKKAKKLLVGFLVAFIFISASLSGFLVRTQRHAQHALNESHLRANIFDRAFQIPPEATTEEGAWPSQAQFAAARVDAFVLMDEAIRAFRAGSISLNTLAQRVRTVARKSEQGTLDYAVDSPLEDYSAAGDEEVLTLLFYRAAKILFLHCADAPNALQAEQKVKQLVRERTR